MRRPVLALSAIIVLVTGAFALLRPPDVKVPSLPKRPPASEAEVEEIAIAPSREFENDRFTDAGIVLRGRITARATGEPVAGARIRARTWKVTRWAESGADGSYRFDNMPAGLVFMRVCSPRWLDLNPEPVPLDVGDDAVRNFEVDPGAVLEGVVRDRATGDPVMGVEIRVLENDAKRCVTGTGGWYRFEGLAPGSVTLIAESPEYPDRITTARVREPAETVRHDFVVVPGAIVTGFVTDSTGAPIEGARATVEGRETPVSTTGKRGEFRVKIDAPSGRTRIRIDHHEFTPTDLDPLDLAPGDRHEAGRIVLRSGAWVSGFVVDAEGEAMEGAQVYAEGERRRGRQSTRTGKNGEFRIGPVAPGDVRIVASATPPIETRVTVAGLAEGEVRKGVEVRFPPLASIRARVVDDTGRPVAGVRVTARPRVTNTPSRFRAAVTGADGRVWIRGVTPGQYELVAQKAGKQRVMASTGEQEAVLTIPATGRVKGKVFDLLGKPAGSFGISWRARQHADIEGSVHLSTTGGEFVLSNVPTGAVTLIASAAEAVSSPVTVQVIAGRTVSGIRLDLEKGAEILCTVLRPDGRGCKGALVSVELQAPDLPKMYALGLTRDEGRFDAKPLAGGRAKVTVLAAGFEKIERQVDVIPGQSVNLSVTLRRGNRKRPEAR